MADPRDGPVPGLTRGDHLDARDAFLGMFFAADRRDWEAVRRHLADEIYLDYQSSDGRPPATREAVAVVDSWRSFIPGFDSTHHHLTVVSSRPSGRGVTLDANGTTTHRLDSAAADPRWTVAGYYVAEMIHSERGWAIASLVFVRTWSAGNQQLKTLARQRVSDER